MSRAAIYARRSSQDAKDGQSIEGQIEVCRGVVTNEGYTLVGTYMDDAVRGTTLIRDGLTNCLEAAEQGKFDVLVIEDLSRLGRRQVPLLTLLSELEELGITIHQAHRGELDYDDVLMTGVEAAVAERHSRDATLKGTNARYRKVLMGYVMSSGEKFGYDFDKSDPGGTKLKVNRAEASEVKRVFKEFNKGKTYSEIAQTMKIPKRSGATWEDRSIRRILEDRTYIGEWLYGYQKVKHKGQVKTRFVVDTTETIEASPGVVPDFETLERAKKGVVLVRVPRVIDDRTYYEAKRRIDGVRRAHTQTPTKHVFVLQGRVTCMECGGKFWAKGKGTEELSRYMHRWGQDVYNACPNRSITFGKLEIEHAVLDELVKLWQTKPQEIAEQHRERVSSSQAEIDEINRDIAKHEADLRASVQKNIDGVLSDEAYRDYEAETRARISALEIRRKELSRVVEPAYYDWMPTEEEETQHEIEVFERDGREYFSNDEWFNICDQMNVQVEVISSDSGGREISLKSQLGSVHWGGSTGRLPLPFRGGEQLALHRMF
jgi:DNA invertase Pin-like site-specific DNA recombinase